MKEKTKPRIYQARTDVFGDLWFWECGRKPCQEWTHTPNISRAPRGVGRARKWDRAAYELQEHMKEHPAERPAWLLPVLLVWIGLVLAGYLTMTYAWAETTPPTPPPATPSPSAWSDECTAEDLEDGMCLTYDDIRNQPTYSQGPDGPVLVTP